jgi:hypothetical protein
MNPRIQDAMFIAAIVLLIVTIKTFEA